MMFVEYTRSNQFQVRYLLEGEHSECTGTNTSGELVFAYLILTPERRFGRFAGIAFPRRQPSHVCPLLTASSTQ